MKKLLFTMLCAMLVFLTSCSIEPVEATFDFFEGTYKLTEYTADIPIDLNNDIISSTNLLDETDCENNETLVFDRQGFVYSNLTFNPDVKIILVDAALGKYGLDVMCDTEGVIGSATSYIKNGNTITIDGRVATISGNKIIMIFKNALKIYNQDLSIVLGTKDLKLVYTKQ